MFESYHIPILKQSGVLIFTAASSGVDEIEQSLPKTEAGIPETEVKQADHDLEAGEQYSSQETDADKKKNRASSDSPLTRRSVKQRSVGNTHEKCRLPPPLEYSV